MELEELVIRFRMAMDNVDATFSAIKSTLQGIAQSEAGRGNAARQASTVVSQAYAQQANAARQTSVAVSQAYAQQASAASLAIEAQAKRLDAVNGKIDTQKAKLAQLGAELTRALGFQNSNEGSPRVQKLQAEVQKATNELANLEAQSDKTAAALIKMEDAAVAAGEKQAIAAQKLVEAQELAAQKAEALTEAAVYRQNRTYAQMFSMAARMTGAFQGSSKELRTISTVANVVAQSLGMAGRASTASGQMIAAGGKIAGDGVAAGAATAGRGIMAAMPWITAIGVALNIVISIVGMFKSRAEEAAGAAAKIKIDNIENLTESVNSLGALSAEYEKLATKTEHTSDEKARMLEIEQQLAEKHGIVTQGVDGQSLAYSVLKQRIEEVSAAEKEALRKENVNDLWGKYNTDFLSGEANSAKSFAESATALFVEGVRAGEPEMSDATIEVMGRVYQAALEESNNWISGWSLSGTVSNLFSSIDVEGIVGNFNYDVAEILGDTKLLDTDDKKDAYRDVAAGLIESYVAAFEEGARAAGVAEDMIGAGSSALKETLYLQLGATKDAAGGWTDLAEAQAEAREEVLAYAAAESAGGDATKNIIEKNNEHLKTLNVLWQQQDALAVIADETKKGTAEYAAAQKMLQGVYKTDNWELIGRFVHDSVEEQNYLLLLSQRELETQKERLENGKLFVAELQERAKQAGDWAEHERLGLQYQSLARQGAEVEIALSLGVEAFDAEGAGAEAGEEWRKGFERSVQGAMRDVTSAESSAKGIEENFRAWQVLNDERLRGSKEYEEAVKRITAAYGEGAVDNLDAVRSLMAYEIDLADQQMENALSRLQIRHDELGIEEERLTALRESTDDENEKLEIGRQLLAVQIELLAVERELEATRSEDAGYSELQMQLMASTAEANRLTDALDTSQVQRETIKSQKDFVDGLKGGAEMSAQQKAQFEALKAAYKATDLSDLKAKLTAAFAAAEEGAESAQQAYVDMVADFVAQRDALEAEKINLTGSAEIEIQGAIDQLNALIDYAVANGLDLTGSTQRRSGGGGRRNNAAEEARRAAEEARRAQEAAWQKQLDDQLKFLERKKRLGEISTQEEIRQLEIIMARYARTTQQRIAMEERIFEAKARLRDEEISEIDKLNQGIITALRNRYEEQRKIEEGRLKESRDSWRKWGDENVKAIQAQIDALDELTKFEDREEQERKRLRKIEATQQMLLFATDDYNREQLQKELQRLEEEFARWQRQNALSDQKELLRAEQEAIREKVQAEQEAIDAQSDELARLYDERLKDAALRAEAERMLIQGNQEAILDLIGSYAPDYEAHGKTLGERLIAGLTDNLGPMVDWFEDLNNMIIGVQDRIAQTALDAADAFYAGQHQQVSQQAVGAGSATINPTYIFNVPVESPSDTARKVEQTNEALAALLF